MSLKFLYMIFANEKKEFFFQIIEFANFVAVIFVLNAKISGKNKPTGTYSTPFSFRSSTVNNCSLGPRHAHCTAYQLGENFFSSQQCCGSGSVSTHA